MTSNDHKLRGNKLVANGNLIDALQAYTTAISLSTTSLESSQCLGNRARVRLQLRHLQAALQDMKQSLTLHPASAKNHLTLVNILEQMGNYRDALVELQNIPSPQVTQLHAMNLIKTRLESFLAFSLDPTTHQTFLSHAFASTPHPSSLPQYSHPNIVKQTSTSHGGNGLFATAPIHAGELLLLEYWLVAGSSAMEVAIGCSHLAASHEIANSIMQNDFCAVTTTDTCPYLGVVMANSFALNTIGSRVGLFHKASAINHSCIGNAEVMFLHEHLLLRSSRSIAMGEEILIRYFNVPINPLPKRKQLAQKWEFTCTCPLCAFENEPGQEIVELVNHVTPMFDKGARLFHDHARMPGTPQQLIEAVDVLALAFNAVEQVTALSKWPANYIRSLFWGGYMTYRACLERLTNTKAWDVQAVLSSMFFELEPGSLEHCKFALLQAEWSKFATPPADATTTTTIRERLTHVVRLRWGTENVLDALTRLVDNVPPIVRQPQTTYWCDELLLL